MAHADETLRRWHLAGRQEDLYDRWASLFFPLVGDAAMAEGLCELGMQLVRREAIPGETLRRQFNAIVGAADVTLRFVAHRPEEPH